MCRSPSESVYSPFWGAIDRMINQSGNGSLRRNVDDWSWCFPGQQVFYHQFGDVDHWLDVDGKHPESDRILSFCFGLVETDRKGTYQSPPRLLQLRGPKWPIPRCWPGDPHSRFGKSLVQFSSSLINQQGIFRCWEPLFATILKTNTRIELNYTECPLGKSRCWFLTDFLVRNLKIGQLWKSRRFEMFSGKNLNNAFFEAFESAQ